MVVDDKYLWMAAKTKSLSDNRDIIVMKYQKDNGTLLDVKKYSTDQDEESHDLVSSGEHLYIIADTGKFRNEKNALILKVKK